MALSPVGYGLRLSVVSGRMVGVALTASVRNRDQSALIRALADEEAGSEFAVCFFYAEGRGECGETPCFRVATPHGHFDACGEHVDGLIASLPSEWIEGWRERDPFVVVGEGDDIPF